MNIVSQNHTLVNIFLQEVCVHKFSVKIYSLKIIGKMAGALSQSRCVKRRASRRAVLLRHL